MVQAVTTAEEVQTLRERATILRYTYTAYLVYMCIETHCSIHSTPSAENKTKLEAKFQAKSVVSQ
jgi:hypothetical protein